MKGYTKTDYIERYKGLLHDYFRAASESEKQFAFGRSIEADYVLAVAYGLSPAERAEIYEEIRGKYIN